MQPLLFETSGEFRKWLTKNHGDSSAIWIRFAKKGAPLVSLSRAEALDQALCFGWIDGQTKPLDDIS